MSSQYGELRPANGWDLLTSLGHSCKFQLILHLGSVTARHLVVGVSETLQRWTEGATCIQQGDHHVGHWPTFLVKNTSSCWSNLLFQLVESCWVMPHGAASSPALRLFLRGPPCVIANFTVLIFTISMFMNRHVLEVTLTHPMQRLHMLPDWCIAWPALPLCIARSLRN